MRPLDEHFFSELQGPVQKLQFAQLFPRSNTLDIFVSILNRLKFQPRETGEKISID